MKSPNWGAVAALSLGVSKLTDIAVQGADRLDLDVAPWLKSTTASVLAAAAACYVGRDGRDRVLLFSAVAGGAALVHDRSGDPPPITLQRPRTGPELPPL